MRVPGLHEDLLNYENQYLDEVIRNEPVIFVPREATRHDYS